MKKKTEQQKYDRGQVFVKITALFLAILMIAGTVATLIFALMG